MVARLALAGARKGLLAGAALYLLLVGIHLVNHQRLEPHLGCAIGIDHILLNAPAKALVVVFPNSTIAPQTFGDERPLAGSAEAMDETWSPAGFVVWGVACYALLGFIFGGAVGVRTQASEERR